ncbi:MAG: DegT/DnrJ/EryC1/StrS family aminotransferase [Lachnospiraceae bacterium]|nr:DegT/DnrJ/EryC1/StrS family aminotransferase [Lachnospiraceae bacterium]
MQIKYPITRPYFDEIEINNIRECLASGWVTQGPMVSRFEKKFMELHGGDNAMAVSSCTAGLHLAVISLGIGAGDEVLVPAFTWVTSANCVEYTGARAVFVDVDYRTFNIAPKEIEAHITSRTKAIVVVHEFGKAAPMDEIMGIADKYGLKVIEDCACAIGTTYKGRPVGTIGDVGIFSFHPRKAVTTGEGGICITSDRSLAIKIDSLRNHGASTDAEDSDYGEPWYMGNYDFLGYNYRMSDIQAAVGLAQLDKLKELLNERKKCAKTYIELLRRNDILRLPNVDGDEGHTFQSFVVLLPEGEHELRNRMMRTMKENAIQTRQGTQAVHRLGYYRSKYDIKSEDYPVAAYCEDCTITLPLYPNMTIDEQKYIADIIRNICI